MAVIDIGRQKYRLFQVTRKKIVHLELKDRNLPLRRGVLNKRSIPILVCNRGKCLRFLTESTDGQRQIWLVDMKVKL